MPCSSSSLPTLRKRCLPLPFSPLKGKAILSTCSSHFSSDSFALALPNLTSTRSKTSHTTNTSSCDNRRTSTEPAKPESHDIKSYFSPEPDMIPSDFSPSASHPCGDWPKESLPAQFASVNVDEECFDENNVMLCEPTLGASEISPGLDGYGWEQLWLADQQSLAGAVAVPNQAGIPPRQPNTVPPVFRYHTNANLCGYSAWSNQIVSPATEPVSPATSPSSHWPQVRTTENGYRWRSPHSDQHSPPQFTKLDPAPKARVSTRPRRDSEHSDNHHDNNGGDKNGGKKQGDKVTGNQNAKRKGKKTDSSPLSPNHDDEQYKRIQHRNRIASNKFRNKKREDAVILQARVEELEQHNGDLVNNKAYLIQQIQYCKVLLLQHAKCQCVLIQNYIAVEAQRYIQDIQENPSHQIICPT